MWDGGERLEKSREAQGCKEYERECSHRLRPSKQQRPGEEPDFI